MKKIIFSVFFLFFGLVSVSFALSAEESNSIKNLMFADVDLDHENYFAIYFLYNTEAIEGYSGEGYAREYHPDQAINRAEFLKIIMEGSNMASGASYDSCFPDVAEEAWFATYVCQAKEEAWIQGYPDGYFRPEQTINLVESMKILGEIMDWELEEFSPSEEWYEPYLEIGEERDIISVDDLAGFMSRGDIAELIFRNQQVEELPISSYAEQYVEYFLELYGIPYDGPFGPGGVFGPGGLFGEMGPFYSGGPYVKSGQVFELLDEDFFDDHYCYFSDSGGFYEEVEEALSDYSDEEFEELFSVEDASLTDFGKMFCYEESIPTDLVYFSDELKETYDVSCWTTEVEDELLCYAPPQYATEKEDEEDGEEDGEEDEDEGDEETDGYIFGEIEQSGPVTADGSSLLVTVSLVSEEGRPVSEHHLKAMVTTPNSFRRFDLEEEEEGTYVLELYSYTATTYVVYVRDEDTGEIYSTEVEFEPGEPESLEILDVTYPFENEDHTGRFIVVLRDEYGNTVSEDEEAVNFTTTLGSLSSTYDESSGVWSVSLDSSELGDATVTVDGPGSYNNLYENVDFSFESVLVGTPRAVEEGESFIVPVTVNMGGQGSLGSYDIRIAFNSAYHQFEDASDGDSTDAFDGPMVSLTGSTILLSQSSNTGEQTDQYVHVADLLFDGMVVGSGTIYAEDTSITNTDEEPVEEYLNEKGERLATVVKQTKQICIDVFVLEGADGITEEDIQDEFDIAEAAFRNATAACNCPYFVDLVLNYRELLRAEWQRVTEGAGSDEATAAEDDLVEEAEMDQLAAAYGSADCIPVFYVPMLEIPDELTGDWFTAGWSASGDPRHIVIDQSRNFHGHVFIHELMHMLSGGEVDDYDPNATDEENKDAVNQGAKDPGNVMNYDDPGFAITAAQCDLIDWDNFPTL